MTQIAAPPQATPRTDAPPVPRRPPGFMSVGWFTGPYLLAFALFLAIPAVYGLWMSFTDRSLTGRETSFVGLANYVEALSDPKMWSALGNTVFFTVITTVPLVLVSLAMALLVATGLPGQWLWRLSYFAPFLLASAVVSAISLWIFQPGGGLVTGVLEYLGVAEIGWLTEEGVAMWSIAIVTLWWTVGFNFLLYLAAIQAIPDHLYEAAAIDGAGPLRRLASITLPMLRRTTGLILLLQVIASLKVFDQIYLVTKGGPNDSTRPVLEYIYDVGFTGYRLGYASAISVIFFVLIMLVSLVQVVRSRREA
jgi:multiple sugar transport system permease protein